ncbi:MAG: YajG family lipoprotein, partial [Burkholderiales bacterium]
GFKVVPPSAEMPNVLTVEVQKITLSSTKEKIKYVTKLEVEIVAKARNGGLKYSRRYSVTAEKESASVSSSENSKLMLNSAVSDGISAMLNDEKLIETLKK